MARIKRNATYSLSIEEAVDSYLSHAKNKNLSEATIDTYQRHLRWLYMLMDEMPVSQLTINDLERMFEEFKETHEYSIRSENNFRRYVNGWLRWLKLEGLIDKEIRLPYKKDTKRIQPVPTNGEMKRLLVKPNLNECTYNHYACYVIINIIASTGLRIRSIANIKKKHIDFQNSTILITAMKNRREQKVMINRKLKVVLKEFLASVDCDSEYLFVDKYNKPFNEKTLSMNVIRYCRSHNIESSAHAIRRWYAVSFMEAGGSIYTLSKALGHSDIQTTQLYLSSCGTENFKDELSALNPLDNLKG